MKERSPDKISKVNRVVAVLALFYGLLFFGILIGSYTFQWQWTGIADRTLWDWMELLLAVAVPVLIGVYGGTISRIQYEGQREAEQRRGQDDALQAYLDQLGQLLLEPDRSLRRSERGSEVRTLARARTLTVLPRLDDDHKARVVQFLHESRLIDKDDLAVALVGADLTGANLRGTDLMASGLSEANLSSADLSRANLIAADLNRANLSKADLNGADLNGANLSGADLSEANLTKADLSKANLTKARGLTDDQLSASRHFSGAIMPNGQKHEDWLENKDRGR